MKRFNEHVSPPVRSRRIQALQILRRLHAVHPDIRDEILRNIELPPGDRDLPEVLEALYQEAIDAGELTECGCCDHYHRPDFRGDCRNDDERFPGW